MNASDGMGVGGSRGRVPPALSIRDEIPGDRESPAGVEGERRVVPQRAADLAVAAGDRKLGGGVVDACKVGWDREGGKPPGFLASLLESGEVVSIHLKDGLRFGEGMSGDGTIALEILEGFSQDHGNGTPVKGVPGGIELSDFGKLAQWGVVFDTKDAGALMCTGGAKSVRASVVSDPLGSCVGKILLLGGEGGGMAVSPNQIPPGSESLGEGGTNPCRHAV